MRKRKKTWLDERVAWHKTALQIAETATREAGEEWTPVAQRIVRRRLDVAEQFTDLFMPDNDGAPFAAYDLAAMVLWPKWRALRLVRQLFRNVPRELHLDDIERFNMDWFYYARVKGIPEAW